jgi:hypothetical protein
MVACIDHAAIIADRADAHKAPGCKKTPFPRSQDPATRAAGGAAPAFAICRRRPAWLVARKRDFGGQKDQAGAVVDARRTVVLERFRRVEEELVTISPRALARLTEKLRLSGKALAAQKIASACNGDGSSTAELDLIEDAQVVAAIDAIGMDESGIDPALARLQRALRATIERETR